MSQIIMIQKTTKLFVSDDGYVLEHTSELTVTGLTKNGDWVLKDEDGTIVDKNKNRGIIVEDWEIKIRE